MDDATNTRRFDPLADKQQASEISTLIATQGYRQTRQAERFAEFLIVVALFVAIAWALK